MNARPADFVMTENAGGISRRSFCSFVAGGFVAAGVTKKGVFAGDDMSASNFASQRDNTQKTHLTWAVFVTPSIPVVTNDFAPGEHERPWPPISSTLIYGSRDAVLVDSFITQEQARAQADWIASTGKNLTTIYATHGHGDHFFGASVLLDRFPKARFVAAPSAIQVMKEQVAPEYVAKFWESRFPNQLPKRLVIAEELRTNVLELEGLPVRFLVHRWAMWGDTSHASERPRAAADLSSRTMIPPMTIRNEALNSSIMILGKRAGSTA